MPAFSINDRVVAVNTDMACPVKNPQQIPLHAFSFPDGPLEPGKLYNIAGLRKDGEGILLTGKRVLQNGKQIPWHFSRFRKIERQDRHASKSRLQPKKASLPV